MEFKALFTQGEIGNMRLRNRIIMPPMGTRLAGEDGSVTRNIIDYYGERARGGAGLIIVECTSVDSPRGLGIWHQLVIDDDRFIPGLSELSGVIKKHGACAAIQLQHAGSGALSWLTKVPAVGPSAVNPFGGEPPLELTVEEIGELVDRFGSAARRAREAGFDGVEIHAAHGYLFSQFLSPLTNKRCDSYGGSIENRARFMLEVLRAAREQAGSDYPVWCRINGAEVGVQGGQTKSEGVALAKMLEQAGAAAVHVSARGHGVYMNTSIPNSPGALVRLAEGIKSEVGIPVITVGRVTPEIGEAVLRDGKTDFVAMGRAHIADPQMPDKISSGRMDEVVPCISCYECATQGTMTCSVNPDAGAEGKCSIGGADKRKKVCVIGGGPAGMQAAKIAALRGHMVILLEQSKRLGGQLIPAAIPPCKESMADLNNYLASQMRKLGIQIRLGEKADVHYINELKPDAVIIATGSKPLVPDIKGIDSGNVVTAVDVLLARVKPGNRVVIIGGEKVACETALYLSEAGKNVAMTRRGPRMATSVTPWLKRWLLDTLYHNGAMMLPGVTYEEITGTGLTVTTEEGNRVELEADTIVLAAGAVPDEDIFNALQGESKSAIHRVGDCIKPGNVHSAIHSATEIGRKI